MSLFGMSEKEKQYQEILLNSENEIMNFISSTLGLGYEKLENVYKGNMWARWKVTFTKKGKLVMQARSVRKSFEVSNGYEVYKIFTGFEII